MPEPVLKINHLEIISGNTTLVNHISLDIFRKSVTGLVGESGSGKTLTALSILRLLPKGVSSPKGSIIFQDNAGQVDLLKVPLKALNRIRGNRISMIFQEPMTCLNPTMKCGRQAMEPLLKVQSSKKKVKEKILQLFDDVQLPQPKSIFDAWPHELSGGQRQRVMIAMALATSPALLIADEPTTALDVTVQSGILRLLNDLKDRYNLGVLFITHDLLVLKQVADNMAVMYQGEILEQGKTKKILENPSTPYAKGLLACRPKLHERPLRLPTISDFMDKDRSKTADMHLRPGYIHPSSSTYHSLKNEEVLLQIDNLHVHFKNQNRSVTAVDSVSSNVYEGETLGLVGESGCGKTTLGRTILQLVRSDSGSVFYRGTALDRLKPNELRKLRRRIQIVFQDPYSSLNPGKTVGNMISEPMFVHHLVTNRKQAEAAVHKLLEQVGLPAGAYNLYPHQFSGGQRQRIGIARALACRPEFMVLDESVSALDVSIQAQILNLLNDLKKEYNLTYIFISHDLTVVKYMSDRVMVMSEGRIIESGTAEQIYLQPSRAYTRKLIDSIPV